jgi:hypothetical protein
MRSIGRMQSPATDSAEYAELLEHIGSAVRLPAAPGDDAPSRFDWMARASAMTHTLVALTAAAVRPRH